MISGIDLRTPLIAELDKIKDQHVTATISAGVDGISCAFALTELGKKVTACSFALEGHNSHDILVAEARAKVFGWDFLPVDIPTDLPNLCDDLVYLAELGATSQTDFECCLPWLYVLETVETEHITTGLGADTYFGLSRKAQQNFVRKGKFAELQRRTYEQSHQKVWPQEIIVDAHASEYGKTVHRPYMDETLVTPLLNKSWDQLNRPNEKQPIRDAWAKFFAKVRTYPHTNYNCGDSGFRKHFDRILSSPLNTRRSRHVRGVYNDLVRRYGSAHVVPEDDDAED